MLYLYNFETHRFMHDNDPKHASHYVANFLDRSYINWWRTSPESPDFNPVENLWHELKEFVCREVKPKTRGELVEGIKRFWETVTVEKCMKYIRH